MRQVGEFSSPLRGRRMGGMLFFLLLISLFLPAGMDAQTPNAVIKGIVWRDENRNGQRDAGEPGLSHVEIRLYREGDPQPLSITYTDGFGRYTFSGLLPGAYHVVEVDPPNYVSSTVNTWHLVLDEGGVAEVNFGDFPVILLTPTATPTPTFSPTPTITPTATSTPVPTATPVPPPTPTPQTPTITPTPTLSPTPWPAWCRNIVRNPDFESDEGWQLPRTRLWPAYVGPFAFPNGGRPHSFQRAVRLGATAPIDPPSYSSASQLITLPADARTITLEYWVWTFSQDDNGGDRQEVLLLDPETRRVRVRVWQAIPAQNARKWERHTFDLTPYRGQSFILYFNVYNEGDNRVSAMFLDDVRVWVCYDVFPTPVLIHMPDLQHNNPRPPTPTSTPSTTPTPTVAAKKTFFRPALPGGRATGWLEQVDRQVRSTLMLLNIYLARACVLGILVLIALVLGITLYSHWKEGRREEG